MNNPVIVLTEIESVRRVLEVLDNDQHTHSGFPVVEDYDQSVVSSNLGIQHLLNCKLITNSSG